MDRREVLRRAALVLGGTLSASAVSGVLAGCEAALAAELPAGALTPAQLELVATIADHIIPRTDTPGARDAGVHRFIDVMMTEYYTKDEREAFVGGLVDVNVRARAAHDQTFTRCTKKQQRTILEMLDAEAFPPRSKPHFFATMKELTILGYYTSQAGATQELRYVQVPGRFDGCYPLAKAGRTWAV
jgi:gluconate 2-dehydrogenase gamma chain